VFSKPFEKSLVSGAIAVVIPPLCSDALRAPK
jgi:hypothetical protein